MRGIVWFVIYWWRVDILNTELWWLSFCWVQGSFFLFFIPSVRPAGYFRSSCQWRANPAMFKYKSKSKSSPTFKSKSTSLKKLKSNQIQIQIHRIWEKCLSPDSNPNPDLDLPAIGSCTKWNIYRKWSVSKKSALPLHFIFTIALLATTSNRLIVLQPFCNKTQVLSYNIESMAVMLRFLITTFQKMIFFLIRTAKILL